MPKFKRRNVFKEWLKAIILALVVSVLMKTFLFEFCIISGTSMESTLKNGDIVLVNKTKYGARMPITLVSIPLLFRKIPFVSHAPSYSEIIQLPYIRFFGTNRIRHNDVIVFNNPEETAYPVDKRNRIAKRCIALPGDTLLIQANKIIINNKPLPECKTTDYDYIVKTTGKKLNKDFIDKYQIMDGGMINESGDYCFALNEKKATLLRNDPMIESVEMLIIPADKINDELFANDLIKKWSLSNFGPIIIPEKGKTVSIDFRNISLYQKIIIDYENNFMELRNDSIFINHTYRTSYTFRMNYYFVTGDNWFNSIDSRYWGFVPEDHIIGKAAKIWFSFDAQKNFLKKIRWSRFFLTIR